MRQLLAHRDARLFLGGDIVSMFGDTSLWLAAAIWVKSLTGSNSAAGLVFFAFGLPQLAAPLFGMVVDRVKRKPLLIAVNLVMGVAVLLLLLVHGRGDVWIIYLVMILYGASYGLLGPAQSALLTVLLPRGPLAGRKLFTPDLSSGHAPHQPNRWGRYFCLARWSLSRDDRRGDVWNSGRQPAAGSGSRGQAEAA